MIRKCSLYVLAAAVLAGAAMGCSTSGTVKHKAELKVSKGSVVFVPFKDAGGFYYDSKDGEGIARGSVVALSQHSETLRPADSIKVRGIVRGAVMSEEMEVDWAEVAKEAGADFVVYGTIDRISWVDQVTPGLPRCSFMVTYFVYDAGADTVIYAASKAGEYPARLFDHYSNAPFQTGVATLIPKAHLYIGRVVASTFFSYEMDKRENELLTVQRIK